MLTVLCFLWRDREFRHRKIYEYGPEYVQVLRNMLGRHLTIPHKLVCVTDDPSGLDGIETRKLPSVGYGMYFPKLYAFHPNGKKLFGDRVLLIDLDTVIRGNIDHLIDRPEPFVSWAAPDGAKSYFNTSMVLMDAGAFPEVYKTFDPEVSPAILSADGYENLDQDWVSRTLGNRPVWARRGEGVESYGYWATRGGVPDTARIVFFNGRRSPAMKTLQQDDPWIAENWR